MADYYQSTPAHPPAQQLYHNQGQAPAAPPQSAQPQALPGATRVFTINN